MKPSIPVLEGLSLAEAASAYANSGFFVAPTKPGDLRNPGSYLGKNWPRWTTRDTDKIERFWARNPDAGIALHTGRSGVVVADIDVDILPSGLECLNLGATQLSRAGARGHRVFATQDTFCSGKLKFNGMEVGDIRSGNTVIVAEPTPHTKGGQYRWLTAGPVPALPAEARALLTQKDKAGAGQVDLKAFVAAHTQEARPHKLAALLMLHTKAAQTRNPHDAMQEALRVGLREAKAGYVPAGKVIAALRKRWDRSPAEFFRLCQWAAAVALDSDTDEIKCVSNRWKGSDSRRYSHVLSQ